MDTSNDLNVEKNGASSDDNTIPQYDTDGSGEIEFPEFCNMMSNKMSQQDDAEMVRTMIMTMMMIIMTMNMMMMMMMMVMIMNMMMMMSNKMSQQDDAEMVRTIYDDHDDDHDNHEDEL